MKVALAYWGRLSFGGDSEGSEGGGRGRVLVLHSRAGRRERRVALVAKPDRGREEVGS